MQLRLLLLQRGPEDGGALQLALHLAQPVLHLAVAVVERRPLHERHLEPALGGRQLVKQRLPAQLQSAQVLSGGLPALRRGAGVQLLPRLNNLAELRESRVTIPKEILKGEINRRWNEMFY